MAMNSGLQAIMRSTGFMASPCWLGGADPRLEGVVMGD
jgi:gamma-glutamyltranspeptidase